MRLLPANFPQRCQHAGGHWQCAEFMWVRCLRSVRKALEHTSLLPFHGRVGTWCVRKPVSQGSKFKVSLFVADSKLDVQTGNWSALHEQYDTYKLWSSAAHEAFIWPAELEEIVLIVSQSLSSCISSIFHKTSKTEISHDIQSPRITKTSICCCCSRPSVTS